MFMQVYKTVSQVEDQFKLEGLLWLNKDDVSNIIVGEKVTYAKMVSGKTYRLFKADKSVIANYESLITNILFPQPQKPQPAPKGFREKPKKK